MDEIKYNTLKMGVPSDWKGDSMIVWKGPQDGDGYLTMVVAYTDLQSKGTFEQFVTKQQEELMKAVPDFVLHEKINGIQCIKKKHSWRSERVSLTQIQYTF